MADTAYCHRRSIAGYDWHFIGGPTRAFRQGRARSTKSGLPSPSPTNSMGPA